MKLYLMSLRVKKGMTSKNWVCLPTWGSHYIPISGFNDLLLVDLVVPEILLRTMHSKVDFIVVNY